MYFVCLRSVYCIQCLQLPIPGCPVSFLCLCCVFCFGYNKQNEEKQNTQHKHRKPTGQPGMGSCKHWIQYTERRQTKFLCLCCVFCLSSFCVLYSMFTAAHSWLSCRFSMFVLCILFVFVLCIVSNVYSCPFLVVPSVTTRNGQL
jgi:magnesium-transporting ATPase (P-type)